MKQRYVANEQEWSPGLVLLQDEFERLVGEISRKFVHWGPDSPTWTDVELLPPETELMPCVPTLCTLCASDEALSRCLRISEERWRNAILQRCETMLENCRVDAKQLWQGHGPISV